MSESAHTGGSRPSKTNPADEQKRRYGPSRGESLSTVLTERDGVTLRREVEDHVAGGGDERRPVSWREATWRFRDYLRDSEDTAAIFENVESGRRVEGGDPHRFDPDYSAKQYAKLKDLERGLRGAYGRRLHTALLSLSSTTTTDDGSPRPPVDHLNDVLSSTEAVMRSLRRVMGGRRWEYLVILEPHKSGYLHVHIAVFVDGVVLSEEFRPVLDAHLRNCEGAGADAHTIGGDGSAVSVRHVGGSREDGSVSNLGTYLGEYLGVYGDDPLDADEHVQMANTVLWATGRRRWRPSNPDYLECSECGAMHHPAAVCHECGSNETEPRPANYSVGAQTYMAANRGGDDEPSPWRLVALRDGDEEHDVSNTGGGTERFTTGPTFGSTRPPPPD